MGKASNAKKKRRHHTVPICYLKNFTDAAGMLHVLRESAYLVVHPKAILAENDFYTIRLENGEETVVVEDTLMHIEGHFANIFREKLSIGSSVDPRERLLVSIFVASMFLRCKSRRISYENFFADVRELVDHMNAMPEEDKRRAAEMHISSGPSYDTEELLRAGENMNSLQAITLANQLERTAQIIYDMKWAFARLLPGQGTFITSDSPVSMTNPVLNVKFGMDSMGASPGFLQPDVDVQMPLSSNMALIMGWNIEHDGFHVPVNDEFRKLLNWRTMRQASSEIVANSKEALAGINHGPRPNFD